MADAELPTMTASAYTSMPVDLSTGIWPDTDPTAESRWRDATNAYWRITERPTSTTIFHHPSPTITEPPMAAASLRIVRVFLVDTDDRVPADKRVLHASGELTTESDDLELFHELPVPIGELLNQHNAYRTLVEWEDKEGKRHTGLKPIRIRDLTMTVTTIASFPPKTRP